MAELEHVKGLKELSDALKLLPDRIARNALRGAVSAAAAVVRKEARERAPVSTGPLKPGDPAPGTLKRAIFQKQIPELSSLLSQTFYVGVRHGKRYRVRGTKGNRSQDAYYWRWVEFGTARMSARPFLRPAFEAQKQAAVQALADYLAVRIREEVTKLPGSKR